MSLFCTARPIPLSQGMLDIDYSTRLTIDAVLQHEWVVKKHTRGYEQDEVQIPNNIAEVGYWEVTDPCLHSAQRCF